MPIPKDILDVERPKNSIVIAYGKNKDRFAVRTRIGCKNVNGRHVPINGPTIGHIVNHQFIPIDQDREAQKKTSAATVDIKDWADAQLMYNLSDDLLQQLRDIYPEKDAERLFVISILRACHHNLSDCEIQEAYQNSFLSEMYPGLALSKNTVSEFLKRIGKAYASIVRFMQNRAKRVNLDHHLLVDGTLKTNDSKVNSLSDFSYKARLKGARDISIIFAFDLEEKELICSQCFPGNMLDLTAYSRFISDNHISQGLIVADKGFPSSAAHSEFETHPNLHYLNPIKRNSQLIENHRLTHLTDQLPKHPLVTYAKAKCRGKNKWLYAFRDAELASQEERGWLEQVSKTSQYSLEALNKKRKSFGTIVLESDLDMPALTAYEAYSQRWEIELVMRYYKHACGFTNTREQSDYTVYASEFCDFLATCITFRLLKRIEQSEELSTMPYKKILKALQRAKKYRLAGQEWQMVKLGTTGEKVLQLLDLIPKPQEPLKRKPGRPRKVNPGV